MFPGICRPAQDACKGFYGYSSEGFGVHLWKFVRMHVSLHLMEEEEVPSKFSYMKQNMVRRITSLGFG